MTTIKFVLSNEASFNYVCSARCHKQRKYIVRVLGLRFGVLKYSVRVFYTIWSVPNKFVQIKFVTQSKTYAIIATNSCWLNLLLHSNSFCLSACKILYCIVFNACILRRIFSAHHVIHVLAAGICNISTSSCIWSIIV